MWLAFVSCFVSDLSFWVFSSRRTFFDLAECAKQSLVAF